MSTETPKQKPTIVTKYVRHNFDINEKVSLGEELARAHSAIGVLEDEFEQIKSSHKAKVTTHAARISCLGTDIQNGFDLRNQECRMEFDVSRKLRLYYLVSAPADAKPVSEEPMDQSDFQSELLQAESKFNHRGEVVLFQPAGSDNGIIAVGELKGRWYSALRIQIGANKINERLDSEQKSYKTRPDAIRTAVKRAGEWISGTMGEQVWKGFADKIKAAEEAEKEKAE